MKAKKDWAVLKWVFQVSRPALWWTALLIVLRVLQGISCIIYAYQLGQVINYAQAGISDIFFHQLIWFLVLVAITIVLQASGRYVMEKSKVTLDKVFRVHTFSELLRREYAGISRTHTGEWMNRIISDCNVVTLAVSSIVPELTGILVRMVGAFFSLLQIMPFITILLIPGTIIMGSFAYFLRKRLKQLHKATQQADGNARSFMQERLSSQLVVRAFAQEASSSKKAADRMDDYTDARMHRFRFVNLSFTSLSIVMNGAQVLGIGLCGWGILTGTMGYGTMSSILYLINLLEAPLTNISTYLSQYSSMLASAERLMEIEEFSLDIQRPPLPQEAVLQYYNQDFAAFGLHNVSFSYDEGEENIILKNFSLEVRKGEFIAFTGESGCGKSTSMKLLLALYPFDSGHAYLRSTDGSQQVLDASWRRLFAYVPQGNQLISGTIRETLAFGDEALMCQEDKIRTALQIACADTFIDELPDGLDTILGERGSGLSEGQMQRLSVARAVLSGRPILLLDEATSALDAATEEQLLENLRAMTDRTVLIITHREAALDICDKQIHFENNQ